MKITESNKETVKAFMRILRDMNVEREVSEMICIMLRDRNDMDTVVSYIRQNPTATEDEIFQMAENLVFPPHRT